MIRKTVYFVISIFQSIVPNIESHISGLPHTPLIRFDSINEAFDDLISVNTFKFSAQIIWGMTRSRDIIKRFILSMYPFRLEDSIRVIIRNFFLILVTYYVILLSFHEYVSHHFSMEKVSKDIKQLKLYESRYLEGL